jgi:hypothetical protein
LPSSSLPPELGARVALHQRLATSGTSDARTHEQVLAGRVGF